MAASPLIHARRAFQLNSHTRAEFAMQAELRKAQLNSAFHAELRRMMFDASRQMMRPSDMMFAVQMMYGSCEPNE